MARVVGDAGEYTFYLRRADGTYDHDCKISAPSVTRVIKTVLASRALMNWHYTQTRDNIAVLLDFLANNPPEELLDEDGLTPLDYFSDADLLEETLAKNEMRPEDIRDEASVRGDAAHDLLANLAQADLNPDLEPLDLAEKTLRHPNSDPFQRAVARWWLGRRPKVMMSEEVVFQLNPLYAGSLDLVWQDSAAPGLRTTTDLKSRKAKIVERGEYTDMYESDEIQVAAYQAAHPFSHGLSTERRSILIVRADESFDEYEATLPVDLFYNLLAVYNGLRGREVS